MGFGCGFVKRVSFSLSLGRYFEFEMNLVFCFNPNLLEFPRLPPFFRNPNLQLHIYSLFDSKMGRFFLTGIFETDNREGENFGAGNF